MLRKNAHRIGGWRAITSAGGKEMRKQGAILALLITLLLVSSCTVVPISQGGSSQLSGQSGNFNASQFVDSAWDTKVIPTISQKAVDMTTLIDALQKDQAAAEKQYGRQESGSYSFMVKGEGKVTKVDTSSINGLVTVDLPPHDGKHIVNLQIGPLITGESLRDAVGLFNFGDFTNQIEYGAVSNALNDKAAKTVSSSIKPDQLMGKDVSFLGTFTFTDLKNILITPVKLEVKGS
jgi:predicted lipoprotein